MAEIKVVTLNVDLPQEMLAALIGLQGGQYDDTARLQPQASPQLPPQTITYSLPPASTPASELARQLPPDLNCEPADFPEPFSMVSPLRPEMGGQLEPEMGGQLEILRQPEPELVKNSGWLPLPANVDWISLGQIAGVGLIIGLALLLGLNKEKITAALETAAPTASVDTETAKTAETVETAETAETVEATEQPSQQPVEASAPPSKLIDLLTPR